MRISIKYLLVILLAAFVSNGFSQEKVGSSAPNFEGKTIKGKEIKLSAYADKVVLVDFWTSSCPPCRQEMPELIKFYR